MKILGDQYKIKILNYSHDLDLSSKESIYVFNII